MQRRHKDQFETEAVELYRAFRFNVDTANDTQKSKDKKMLALESLNSSSLRGRGRENRLNLEAQMLNPDEYREKAALAKLKGREHYLANIVLYQEMAFREAYRAGKIDNFEMSRGEQVTFIKSLEAVDAIKPSPSGSNLAYRPMPFPRTEPSGGVA